MKVFLTGGTGFVGKALVERLSASGHEVTVLSRSGGDPAQNKAIFIQGDPTQEGSWQDTAAGADVLINLAGASIFGRWNKKYKKRLIQSRILTTQNIVQAMSLTSPSDKTLLSASAVGYYGFQGDEELDENDPPGADFLAKLCSEWESEALKAAETGHRVILMRLGIVLEKDGGALGQMLPLFKKGLGGRLGSGRQWLSWIHRRDLVRAAEFLINHPDARGPFNLTAPHPVTNRELTKTLGRTLHRPTILPAPGPAIKLVMGEMASVLLQGQNVRPKRLLEMGFDFEFPALEDALRGILGGGNEK